MTEAQWLACTDPEPMLDVLRCQASDRKLRLFACACCRLVWHLLSDEQSRNAVGVAERFADGNATDVELVESHHAAKRFRGPWFRDSEEMAADAAANAAQVVSNTVTSVASDVVCAAMNWCDHSGKAEGDYDEAVIVHKQVLLIGDIFGNPFRPVSVSPAWQTPTVVSLAQAAYDERILPAGTLEPARLAVLADALEETGCSNPDILSHLRSPGTHVRGCWVVDLLGKERCHD
jgi:hypothetical protein